MKFNISSVINPNNVNLGFLEDIKYTSSDVVKVSKLTNLLPDNTIPIFTDFTKTTVSNDGNVNLDNNTTDILFANDAILDEETLDVLPLWYNHNTKKRYYNITKDERDVYVRIPGNVIDNLVPTGSNLAIIKGNIEVFYRFQGAYNILAEQYYKVDFPNNRIVITDKNFIDAAKDDPSSPDVGLYRAKYSVFSPDITIKDSFENILSSTKYAVVATAVEGVDNIYEVDIYTWFNNSTEVSYFVSYRTVENNVPVETKEILRVYPIYQPANEYEDIINRNDPRYYIDENYDIRTQLTPYDNVYIKYNLKNNEYIELRAPVNLPKNIAWYIDVKAGRFTNRDNGLTYEVLEKNKYLLKNEFRIAKAVVEPVLLTNRSLKLFHNNLYVNIDNQSRFTNIQLYIDGRDETSLITDIDVINGVLYLSDIVSINKNIVVHYYYRSKFVPYEFINVNPVKKYKDNEDVIAKYIVMFMLPREYLNQNLNRSVFHKIVYKHPGSIKDIKNEELNVTKCINFIEGKDDTGRSLIYDQVTNFLTTDTPDDLQPIVLGSVSINQIVHPDSYDILDIRNAGQVAAEVYTLAQLLDFNKDVISYTDIGRFDNEPLKINSVIFVKVPRRLYNKLHHMFYNYDTDTIRKERVIPGTTDSIVKQFVYRTIKKYFKVGTYVKVEYEGDPTDVAPDYSGFSDEQNKQEFIPLV